MAAQLDDEVDPSRPPGLSNSEQENLDVLAAHYEQEDAKASRIQVGIEKVSSFFGSPAYFAFAAIFIALWISVSTWGHAHGWRHVDDPPFYYLQGLVSAHALLLTIAVLIRQNRMSQLAEQRAHLDLQINLLTEQKVTRVLKELLHEDLGPTRADEPLETAELTRPADPGAILAAIKDREEASKQAR